MKPSTIRRRGQHSASSASLGLSRAKKTTASVMEGVGQDVQLLLNRPVSMVTGMAPPPFFGEITEDVEVFVEACRRAVDYNCWKSWEIVSKLSYFLEGKAKWAYKGKLNDCWAKEEARLEQELAMITGDVPKATDGPSRRMQLQWECNIIAAVKAVGDTYQQELRRTEHEMIDVEGLMRQCDREFGAAAGALLAYQVPDQSGTTEVKTEEVNRAATGEAAPDDDDTSEANENEAEGTQSRSTPIPRVLTQAEQAAKAQLQVDMQQASLRHAELNDQLQVLKTRIRTHSERLARAESQAEEEATAEYKRVMATTASATKTDADEEPTLEEKKKNKDFLAFPTVEEFYAWLCATFLSKDTRNKWMSAYYGRRHKKNESVRDYSLYLTMLGHRAGLKPTEASRTQHFFDGLHKRMKMVIKRMWAQGELSTSPKFQWDLLVRTAEQLEKDIPELCPGEGDYGDYGHDEDGTALQASDGTTMAVAQPHVNYYDSVQAVDEYDEQAQRVSSGREQGTVAVAAPPVRNNNGRSSSTEASDMRAMMHQMTSLLTTMNNEKKAQPVVNQMRMPPMPMPMAPMPMPPPVMMPPCAQCGLVGHLASHCNTRMRRSIVCYNCGEPGHLSTACRHPPSGATLRRQGQGRPGQGRNNNRRAGQGVTCYRCGVPGHISPQCPQSPNGGGASSAPAKPEVPLCANCNKRGHFASECRSGRTLKQMSGNNKQGNDQRA